MKNDSHISGLFSVSIFVIVLLSVDAGAQTTINSCTKLDSPGYYVLDQDLKDSSAICINITSSDVIFDGSGHVIEGSNIVYGDGIFGSYGVYASSPGAEDDLPSLSNVTVKNVTLKNRY